MQTGGLRRSSTRNSDMNGAFINDKMKVVPVKANFDEEVRKRLWRMYEELTAR